MNKPYLMICVEKPKDSEGHSRESQWPDWYYFAGEYAKLDLTFEPHERPVENVWLIDVSTRLKSATAILGLLNHCQVAAQTFYLSEPPTVAK